jgi:hypothetical protein
MLYLGYSCQHDPFPIAKKETELLFTENQKYVVLTFDCSIRFGWSVLTVKARQVWILDVVSVQCCLLSRLDSIDSNDTQNVSRKYANINNSVIQTKIVRHRGLK